MEKLTAVKPMKVKSMKIIVMVETENTSNAKKTERNNKQHTGTQRKHREN